MTIWALLPTGLGFILPHDHVPVWQMSPLDRVIWVNQRALGVISVSFEPIKLAFRLNNVVLQHDLIGWRMNSTAL